MENNLNDLESKIDQLLKALGQDEVDLDLDVDNEDEDEGEEKEKSESTSHASSEEKKTAEK